MSKTADVNSPSGQYKIETLIDKYAVNGGLK